MAMNDLGVIDSFMATFTSMIDSGFGLLSGNITTLSTILIGIDITLAGLFWTMDEGADILARLLRKILYVGVFAFILNNFQTLANIVFQSFAQLGLQAAASGLAVNDLLKPGKLAGVGFQAAWPLLKEVGSLMAYGGFIFNFLTIIVLLFAWFIIIILSVQLFITILEFKLTTLAGFVLVPFALWNKTAFLAERVLGNVIASGIKVMVLAVIVGIGSSFFSQFTGALQGQQPNIAQAMSLVLASLALLGLGIFGPAIASGLVSGAPQLGAGAAIGTLGGAAGAVMLAGGAVAGGARLLGAAGSGGMAAIRAGTAMGSAASTAYQLGQATSGASGMAGVGAGVGGVMRAGAGAVAQKARSVAGQAADSLSESAQAGRKAAWQATGGNPVTSTSDMVAASSSNTVPPWAQRLRAEQAARAQRHAAAQAVKDGDRPVAPATPDLSGKEE
jgi:type IV secretion system protein TrbL